MSALTELLSSRELLVNLTLREIRGKYKRTVLGQVWSLINPIAQMAIYSVVFGFILQVKPGVGDPSGLHVFALWLSAALLPWLFFANVVTSGMGALLSNANLIQKVYFPRETLIISNMFSWLFNHVIEMGVLVVAVLLFGGQPLLYLPATLLLMFALAMFALGVSYALSVAAVYFRDTLHFITLFMQLWLYATPVLYSPTLVANRSIHHPSLHLLFIYRLNPMERFSESFRNTIYDGRWPSWSNMVYVLVVSFAVLVLGRTIFLRFSPRLAEEL